MIDISLYNYTLDGGALCISCFTRKFVSHSTGTWKTSVSIFERRTLTWTDGLIDYPWTDTTPSHHQQITFWDCFSHILCYAVPWDFIVSATMCLSRSLNHWHSVKNSSCSASMSAKAGFPPVLWPKKVWQETSKHKNVVWAVIICLERTTNSNTTAPLMAYSHTTDSSHCYYHAAW